MESRRQESNIKIRQQRISASSQVASLGIQSKGQIAKSAVRPSRKLNVGCEKKKGRVKVPEN